MDNMVNTDDLGTKVKTKYKNIIPKGTVCEIRDCRFVGNFTLRAYLVETPTGEALWFLDRDLDNV